MFEVVENTGFEDSPASGRAGQGAAVAASGRGRGLSVRGLSKSYDGREVLKAVDLDIAAGEFIAIVGRSGCGKSTLLRLIAGLDTADAGLVSHGAAPVGPDTDASRNGQDTWPAHARPADMADTRIMFQEPRLLPWKTVLENVALGLPRAARGAAEKCLGLVGLAQRAGEWPAVLSGGQRQRVALARALVHEPELLLLDEPLGALDALTRHDMQCLIETLWRERGFTALLVTHDVQEAVALADRVLLVEDGRVTLDQRIDLPRPRHRSDPGYAQLEESILQRVLSRA